MNNFDYILPVDKEKRLYYQYLGFLNTFDLFTNPINNIEIFAIEPSFISFDDFKNFTLTKHMTLGKKVEVFFEYYITSNKNYQILLKNIQVISNKITLGEFDFIIKNIITNDIFHVELAYKFYLYKNLSLNEIENYVGPNAHDTLQDRLNKLKDKQFPLLYKKESKAFLNDLNIENIMQKLLLKANIFLPYENTETTFKEINKNCKKGFYINKQVFLKEEIFKSYLYFIPQKQDWLIEAKNCQIWYDFNEIQTEITQHLNNNINPLIWIKKDDVFISLFVGDF